MSEHLIHAFNVNVAKKIGLEEAIIIHSLLFWIEKSKGSDKNFFDGYYWTYNTLTELQRLFPYMSDSTIKRKIQNLKDCGLILVAQHAKYWSNRTNYYTVDSVKLTQCIQSDPMREGQSDLMGKGQNDPLFINSSNNSSNTVVESAPSFLKTEDTTPKVPLNPPFNAEEEFEKVYKAYPRKEGKKEAFKHFKATVKTKEDLDNIYKALANYIIKLKLEKIEPQYIKMASTWFNNWTDYVEWKPLVKPTERTMNQL